ncbi:hypothetical protein [Solibacillus sp. FSL H8-0538]|uniref:hypothetical protein n=1 Tax=Solibacillus sp. FSL H8-0538 TaxID=2921400 RepID=UPI0030FB1850
MKYIFSIVMAAVLSVYVLPSTSQANATPYYIVTPEVGVTMTATADAAGMTVAKLKQGARVEPIAQENGWTKVLYHNRLGWVKSDFIKPFTIDLTRSYSTYYKQLSETANIVYALVHDFTQDGVEELYVVTDSDTSKGEYVETVYSGPDVIYKKTLTDGLTIVRNTNDYYVKHDTRTKRGSAYPLSKLNDQAKTDYYVISGGNEKYEVPTNSYFNSLFVLQSGSGAVSERTYLIEEVVSKEYFGGQQKNAYNETIYAMHYSMTENGKKKSVTNKDFEMEISPYVNAKAVMEIYKDDDQSATLSNSYSFHVENVQQQLLALAEKSTGTQQELVKSYAGWDEEELVTLQQKLAQSLILEIPFRFEMERNLVSYFSNVEIGIARGLPYYDPVFFTRSRTGEDERGYTYYDRAPIDQVIYDFYGVKMDTATFNAQAGENGPSVDDFQYISLFSETQPGETYPYRQLIDIKELENDYVAMQFDDYSVPWDIIIDHTNESALIAGTYDKSGSVIFKRLPFEQGTKWVYIDTVESLNEVNIEQYKHYVNNLHVIQELSAEQKVNEVAVTPAQTTEQPLLAPVEDRAESSIGIWLIFATLIFALASGGALFWFKRKKDAV